MICDVDGCPHVAEWRIEGRWSSATWHWIDVCEVHVSKAVGALERRTVDGGPCLEIGIVDLEPAEYW